MASTDNALTGLTVKSVTKAEAIKQLILKDIRSGLYRAGDALPSVRDMAGHYRVSKSTITQALSNLNELRVVDVGQGKTTRVRGNPFHRHVELLYAGLATVETQDFWSGIYRGFLAEAGEREGYTHRHSTLPDVDGTLCFDIFDPVRTSALVVLGTSRAEFYQALRQYDLPMLAVYEYPDEAFLPSFAVDFAGVADDIARRFAQRGCRRVAFLHCREVVEPKDFPRRGVTRHKFDCLRNALLTHGVMPDESHIVESLRSYDDGYTLFKRLVGQRHAPDGLVLSTDAVAPGVYRAAHELGVRIPEDLPVVGCDNLRYGQYMVPSLSTIEVRREALGRLAFRRLAEHLDDGRPLESEWIPAELVVRESFS